MDSLEINVEPAKGSDELGLEGIATQIDCDDVDLSPARENVKFFSQHSVSNFISNFNCLASIFGCEVVVSCPLFCKCVADKQQKHFYREKRS